MAAHRTPVRPIASAMLLGGAAWLASLHEGAGAGGPWVAMGFLGLACMLAGLAAGVWTRRRIDVAPEAARSARTPGQVYRALLAIACVAAWSCLHDDWFTSRTGLYLSSLLVTVLVLPLLPASPRQVLPLVWRWSFLAPTLAVGAISCGIFVFRDGIGRLEYTTREALFGYLAASLVGAPVMEELLYRGALWHACRRLSPAWVAVLLTAGLFTLSHQGVLMQPVILDIALLGLLLGWLRAHTGSVLPGILAHALANGLPKLLGLLFAASAMGLDARPPVVTQLITVRADQPGSATAPRLGVCLEDVNHEVYGGLYSQLLFGESFQEPPPCRVAGFTAHGGDWRLDGDTVGIAGGDGPKLLADAPILADGTVTVQLRLDDRDGDNAGLIVRARECSTGADAFVGYEVAIDARRQMVRLARHVHDFRLIEDAPAKVPVRQWCTLAVRLDGPRLEVRFDGELVVAHDDGAAALPAGVVGLRVWHARAGFRGLTLDHGDGSGPQPLAFALADARGEVSGMWRPFASGTASARFSLPGEHPFGGVQCQRLEFAGGDGEVGIDNRGLGRQGIHLLEGRQYEGCVWVRAARDATLIASLRSEAGAVLAERSLVVGGGDWLRLALSLVPGSSAARGSFALSLRGPGVVDVAYAFLQPGDWGRFAGLPVRRDVAEALRGLGLALIRYGGSMINSPDYRWKRMTGPRDQRPPYAGTWYPHSSNGFAVFDFLDLCEALGVVAVPVLNLDETPPDLADFVDYCNGDAQRTEWGRRRAQDGHPEPYRLRYLELGNEERIDAARAATFNAAAAAIWARDPDIQLVVGDFRYTQPIADPNHVTGADSGITNLDGHRAILAHGKAHGRSVWFDVHLWTERSDQLGDLSALSSYVDALAAIADGAEHEVVVFELNANRHDLDRALANALAIAAIRRDGLIPMVASANALQVDGHNDNGWDQGLVFLDPEHAWLQPPGHALAMLGSWPQGATLPVEVETRGPARLDVVAWRSGEDAGLRLQVVNRGDAPVLAIVLLPGIAPGRRLGVGSELAGAPGAVNPAAGPEVIAPRVSFWRPAGTNPGAVYAFPPHSLTVLRSR